MPDVGSVITAQVDLIWSVALALLIVEVLIAARFLTTKGEGLDGLSWFFFGVSIASLLVSMLFGYFTYGSVVEMVRATEDANSASISFDDAGFSALWQFILFAAGLILFIILFALNTKKIGTAIAEGR